MTKFKFTDVVLVIFRHPNGEAKKRPALVVLDVGDDDIVLAPITSRERNGDGDCKTEFWRQAGLLSSSWVRLAKIACLDKLDIERKLGRLSSQDKKNVISTWNKLYRFK